MTKVISNQDVCHLHTSGAPLFLPFEQIRHKGVKYEDSNVWLGVSTTYFRRIRNGLTQALLCAGHKVQFVIPQAKVE